MKLTAPLLLLVACLATVTHGFVHPGLYNTDRQFQARRFGIGSQIQPWTADFALLRNNTYNSPSRTPRPVSLLIRGANTNLPAQNYPNLYQDAASAYAMALDWQISGDVSRANAAAKVLTAWGSTLQQINGTSDMYLAAGIYGYQLAVAAETLRNFPGWGQADRTVFNNMLQTVFAPMNLNFLQTHLGAKIDHYWANWDLCNLASLMAIGIYLDRLDYVKFATTYYLTGAGNGAIKNAAWVVYPDGLAQWQESGRDQGHSMLGIGLAASICQMAWTQGFDLYSAYDNLLLKAARYVAKYNLGGDVNYTSYTNSDVTQPTISSTGRGAARPIWAMLYGHYVQQQRMAAPEILAMVLKNGIEGGGGNYGTTSGGFDHLGWGTLTFLVPGPRLSNLNLNFNASIWNSTLA